MKVWSDIGFEIETTADGSLSLRQLQSVDPEKYRGESMHHSGGAWAETALIYGNPIREALEQFVRPHFMIVGLGLGYIEMTIAREALLLGLQSQDVGLITSFESIPELRYFFFAWIHDKSEQIHPEIWQTYSKVASDILLNTALSESDLKIFLKNHFKTLSDLEGALSSEINLTSTYQVILYDAFSSKTTPFLWEEDFLKSFLTQASAPTCYFSTYASRVGLKKALSETGFEVITRPGFKGKRNSTLGIKPPRAI